ncbi:hypothetical protein CAPTEDRAFT_228675 [Capitella teleta]|uniref:NADH-ubiquinone oxidoreductase chain 4 n=1 Tax=Capitella teleta TaxID=283909 RepID=R7UXV2_CAPTE|nr:hypothetical protein CAPTEDRAFT_228675 [Capitella teleta]|eukprot:ELU08246.1 hypothetical protein CAPTEDRAFT_228675 [Capitella teleta]
MFWLSLIVLPLLVAPFRGYNFFILDEGLIYMATGGPRFNYLNFFYFLIGLLCLILVIFSLIPITIMVLGWGYQPERLQASNYLVLYTVGARLPLLVIICMMHFFNGHTSLYLSLWGVVSFYNLRVWWVLLIFAFLVKTPLYFFHLWLPKAHVEAPVAGSMILAGSISSRVCCLLTSVAVWGGVVCRLICLRQTDIKSLIAYSSVTHMGVIGALIIIISHGLVSSSMFLGAYIIMSANMGVPPTINLQREIILVARVVRVSKGFILPISLALFFSAAYRLLLYSSTQNGGLRGLSFFFFELSYRDLVAIFLHLVPAYILIVNGDLLIN